MRIQMDNTNNTTIETIADLLTICDNEDEDTMVQIPLDRAEEFIGHIRTVVEFHNNQQNGGKDAGSISAE
jgi:hypothetical protein